jgi:hypothetical protein
MFQYVESIFCVKYVLIFSKQLYKAILHHDKYG